MASIEASLNAVHAAGLIVVVAGEDDRGDWIVSLATSRTASLKTWKSGRGKSLDAALSQAIIKPAKKPSLPKIEKPYRDFEDLV